MAARKAGDWIDSFLKLTENTEPPMIYRKWTAISTLASAMRRKCALNWGNVGNFYPNMYIILVGPSGARKTTAMRLGEWFLDKIGIFKSSDSITREALIGELETSTDTSPHDFKTHSSITVFAEELTVFLGYNNDELMASLCAWFDCKEKWTYKTKTSGENEILGVWLNLLGATTPTLLRGNLPMDAIGGGLASRIIFVYARTKGKSVPFPFNTPEEVNLQKKLLLDYQTIAGLKGEFKFTQEFADAYGVWYIAQEKEDQFQHNPKFEGYSTRRPGHLLKLCMILSASRDNKMVLDEEIFKKAVFTLEEVEEHMPGVFDGMGKADTAELQMQIYKFIEAHEPVYRETLIARFRQDVDRVQQLAEILDLFHSSGIIEIVRDAANKAMYKTKVKK